jgi:phospholipid/cholesterol/gamma-HCH transport system substrate-binding protein
MIQQINLEKSTAGVIFNDTITGKKMRDIITNLETSSTEIDKMTKNINIVVDEIKEGKGAINYLVNDSTFVNNLNTTIKNIEEGSIRFNENMEALKHNFLTRGYFKKLERQKKKDALNQ